MITTEFKTFIEKLAAAGAEIILPAFRREGLAVELKSDRSIVTATDREVESRLRDLIRQEYPQHGVIGEEFGSENEGAEFVWVLDPIDGTISFVGGCPLFGTLIGLLHQGRPMLGCINQPVLKQCCLGDGKSCTLNGKPVAMRPCRSLAEATLLATDIQEIAHSRNQSAFNELLNQVSVFRTWGDCYGYLLAATGYADIMLDPIMHPWDVLPLIPIIEGAGGVITAWDGSDAARGNSCIAAAPQIHGAVRQLLGPE